MDCSPPGFSVHGIFQARVLEWVAISFSRGSSQPRDRTRVSHTAGRCFTVWATREAHGKAYILPNLPHYKKYTPETCKPPYNSHTLPRCLLCLYQIVPKSLTIDPWWTQMYFCDIVHAQGFYKCQTVKNADLSPEMDLLQVTTFNHRKPTWRHCRETQRR